MFESFIGLIIIAALIATVIWLHTRLSRMEREHKALLTFVLGNHDLGPQPAAASGAAAAESEASPSAAIVSAEAFVLERHSAEEGGIEPPVELESAAGAQEVASNADAGPAVSVPQVPSRTRDVETALGTRWAVWVGGLALALGGVFLVRYSIEAGWFGPAARITLATLFGILLLAAGEFIRRSGFRMPVKGAVAAYIPAILTAAGAFTLFGAIYAAHGVYGFIGPAVAFFFLGLVGIATMAAALVHGQALGGLGLLGSLATPVLVASEAPSPWTLFIYLAIVLVSTVAVARLRSWVFLAAAAFAGTGLWILVYLGAASATERDLNAVLFISLVMAAALALIWLREGWARMDWASVATALPVGIAALALCCAPELQAAGGLNHGAVIIAAMVAVAMWREAALPLLFGAGTAAAIAYLYSALSGTFYLEFAGGAVIVEGMPAPPPAARLQPVGWLLAALFLGGGMWKARSLVATKRNALAWSAWGAGLPVLVAVCLWISFGNLDRDYFHAAMALLMTVLLAAAGEWLARAEAPPLTGGHSVSAALLGAGAGAAAFLHMAFGPGLTTVIIGATAMLPAFATRWRAYPVLGWLCVGSAVIVLARMAMDPTIVGPMSLGRTPIFNALLPGYGIPALAYCFVAWQLARTTNGRPRLAMEAASVLFVMLAIGMLVRHAMNGGIIDTIRPTLAEQAVYTLMAFGAGAILLAIDRRSPSLVMRYGSIAFGVLSVALVLVQHFLLLNPLVTDESTGRIPVFNLLFLAYLMPAIAAGGLALYARGKRPKWYSAMLGLLGAVLAFAYATLSVRRWFHGEFIGLWRDMTQLETYTYSAVWLALGVAILAIGVRQNSHALRVASAVLIAVAVAKVFLFDMSELEGVLRALSFIGLGIVLIGIGLFYQRLLTRSAEAKEPAAG